MRIAYIAGETAPGQDGGAVHTWSVATCLAELGADVLLVCNRGLLPPREAQGRLTIVRPRLTVGGKMLTALAVKAFKAVRDFHPDLIIERHVSFGGAGYLMSLLFHKPLVLEVNSPHVEELLWRYGIKSRVVRKLLRSWRDEQFKRAAGVIAPLKTIVPEIAQGRTCVVTWAADIPPMFSVDERQKARSELGFSHSDIVFAFVGTFHSWHGVLRLPAILQKVTSVCPNAKMLLIGNGPLFSSVMDQIKKQGLDAHCVAKGAVPHEKVPRLLATSDVGLAPYDLDQYEPLRRFGFYWSPLKIFEYMAAGLPVVTIKAPALENILRETGAGLCVNDTTSDLAEACVTLAQEKPLRTRMGQAGRVAVETKYNWRSHARNLLNFLQSIVKKK